MMRLKYIWGWLRGLSCICTWLSQWILVWLTILQKGRVIVNKQFSCTHARAHLKKTKVWIELTAPRHRLPLFLPPVRLLKAIPEQLLASPCDICSVGVLDRHETLLDEAQRQGAILHQPPCLSEDRP